MKKELTDKLNSETLEYFEKFLLEDLNKNKLTVNNIIRNVRDFIEYLEEQDIEINAKSIKKYLSFIQDSYRESSFITKVSAIRQFVNWLNIVNNPFLEKDFIFNRTDVDFFTDEEFEKIFAKESFDYHELIIRCFYELYLSIQELANLKMKNFNHANFSFEIRETKIKCSSRLSELCKHYLGHQRQMILNHAFYAPEINDVFFVREKQSNTDKQAFSSLELSEIIRTYDLSLNKIKRSRIINLIKAGKTDDEIFDLLGIKISAFYDQFKPKQNYRLLKAYADFHPRSNKS